MTNYASIAWPASCPGPQFGGSPSSWSSVNLYGYTSSSSCLGGFAAGTSFALDVTGYGCTRIAGTQFYVRQSAELYAFRKSCHINVSCFRALQVRAYCSVSSCSSNPISNCALCSGLLMFFNIMNFSMHNVICSSVAVFKVDIMSFFLQRSIPEHVLPVFRAMYSISARVCVRTYPCLLIYVSASLSNIKVLTLFLDLRLS
jgi:hypothetical protein